jgi:hypothetical protein
VQRIGLASHFSGYMNRLHAIVQPTGLRMGLWADMLALLPDAIHELPRGIIAYDWYYYPFPRHPRMELHNFADYDLAPALAKQGIEYWGCPMNGGFRHEPLPVFGDRLGNIQSWWRRCRQTRAGGFLMTGWEPQRLAFEMPMVVDAAAASLWLDPHIDDHVGLLSKGFERVFGKSGSRDAARAALACDEHAFAGYAKWETNDRWDGLAGPEGPSRADRGARFFARLAKRTLPPPFAASAALNAYLATRESFIRHAARTVQKIRRRHATGQTRFVTYYVTNARSAADAFGLRIEAGRVAARAMWVRTRDPGVPSPHEAILARDFERLQAWDQWLAAVAKDSACCLDASPVHGRWQLTFIVHNRAPTLQKLIVEQQSADGTWTALAERFTIEFRAKAARPSTSLRHEFSVSVGSPALPLRITLRGVGTAAVSHVILTDGVVTLRPADWPVRERRPLGTPAPTSGFPDLHLSSNRDAVALVFK